MGIRKDKRVVFHRILLIIVPFPFQLVDPDAHCNHPHPFTPVAGIDLGIFGVPSGRKDQIEQLIAELERHNPIDRPTENLDKVCQL